MSEVFTIERLLQDPNLTAGRRYGMYGIAAEYLSRINIVGDVLEDRTPFELFRDNLTTLQETDPDVGTVAKERMLYAASGQLDPGDEVVREALLAEQARRSQQTEV